MITRMPFSTSLTILMRASLAFIFSLMTAPNFIIILTWMGVTKRTAATPANVAPFIPPKV